jgi:hypothetical protein
MNMNSKESTKGNSMAARRKGICEMNDVEIEAAKRDDMK